MRNPKPVEIKTRKDYVELYTWYKSKIDSIWTWTELSPAETYDRVVNMIYKARDLEEPEFKALFFWNSFLYTEDISAIYKHY